jgi:hypothetical protein
MYPRKIIRAGPLKNKFISFHHAMHTHHHEYRQIQMPQVVVRCLLERRTPLFTGASSGIGNPIAIALRVAGANVCINDVTRSEIL